MVLSRLHSIPTHWIETLAWGQGGGKEREKKNANFKMYFSIRGSILDLWVIQHEYKLLRKKSFHYPDSKII